jgi:hypothetical protein
MHPYGPKTRRIVDDFYDKLTGRYIDALRAGDQEQARALCSIDASRIVSIDYTIIVPRKSLEQAQEKTGSNKRRNELDAA